MISVDRYWDFEIRNGQVGLFPREGSGIPKSEVFLKSGDLVRYWDFNRGVESFGIYLQEGTWIPGRIRGIIINDVGTLIETVHFVGVEPV